MNECTNQRVVDSVQAQYEEFPYPPVASLEQEDVQRQLHSSFNYDLQLADGECLGPSSTVWVPGCGTRWAVMTALQFRGTQIVASDLSRTSLGLQRCIARSLDIDNVEFRRENILEVKYKNSFDFVSCVGVLHHLPDPPAGFEAVARALKHTGTAEIMVYDQTSRRHSIRMQRILHILDPKRRLSASQRFELALRILRAAGPHTERPPELEHVLQMAQISPEFRCELADLISHPQETYYDVASLVAQLHEVGLAVRSWKMPHLFAPEFLLTDPELQLLSARLDPTDRAHLAHLLATGSLDVFVRGLDAGVRGTTIRLEGHTRVRAINKTTVHRLSSSGDLIGREEWSKLTLREGQLWMDAGERRPAVSAFGRAVDGVREHPRKLLTLLDMLFHTVMSNEEILRVVELACPEATIDGICDRLQAETGAARTIDRNAVLALCERLLRPPFRVLALAD